MVEISVFDKVLYLGEKWVVTFINGGTLSMTSEDGTKRSKCHYSVVNKIDSVTGNSNVINIPLCYEHKFIKTLDLKIVREKFSTNMGSEEFPDMEDVITDTIVQKMLCLNCGTHYWHPLEITDTFKNEEECV